MIKNVNYFRYIQDIVAEKAASHYIKCRSREKKYGESRPGGGRTVLLQGQPGGSGKLTIEQGLMLIRTTTA